MYPPPDRYNVRQLIELNDVSLGDRQLSTGLSRRAEPLRPIAWPQMTSREFNANAGLIPNSELSRASMSF